MAFKYLVITALLSICVNANAEWFLRGTHNGWAATQMESVGAGTNTVQLNSVVFNSAGSIKFDRFGDWKESYGNNGGNIAVAAGTWDIKFFTDTKRWTISAPQAQAVYHLRGTNNSWVEGTLMSRVAATDTYELCVNFTAGDGSGGPRFKIDPNGGWGDAIPAADFAVALGWVKVYFNSASKIITVQQGLGVNCGVSAPDSVASSAVSLPPVASSSLANSSVANSSVASSAAASLAPASIYHLRGTFNGWLEGTLMPRIGTTDSYQSCINFAAGDNNGGPRFKVDPNGGWGDAIPAADVGVTAGWVKITFNSVSKAISTQQNLAANCATSEPVSSSSSSRVNTSTSTNTSQPVQTSIYHLRGTFNSWLEGTLMFRKGTSDDYERCINFAGGDGNGGPRFKIDPYGAWGDALPAADYVVAAGWVKITFNSVSKSISVQQNLPENCAAPAASSAASASIVPNASSAIGTSSTPATPSVPYHLRGTFNNWIEGTLMQRVGVTDIYQSCIHFNQLSNRFKVDPNGGWGDALPAADYIVSAGWVKIVYNSLDKSISVQQNLAVNCGSASSSSSAYDANEFIFPAKAVYYLRGDFNGWADGALQLQPELFQGDDGAVTYAACVYMPPGKQRMRIDKNGGWGVDTYPLLNDIELDLAGWTRVAFDRRTGYWMTQGSLGPRCADVPSGDNAYPPDVGVPAPAVTPVAFVPIHIRGTNNAFAEGTLMTQIGRTDSYTACVYFAGGDANGGPRFRVDPNGGWGDAVPAADVNIPAGWVAIAFNNTTKVLTKQYNMAEDCQADGYMIVGSQRQVFYSGDGKPNWLVGDYAGLVDGDKQLWKVCLNFGNTSDANGEPRFRISVNEGRNGDFNTVANFNEKPLYLAHGWTSISFESPPSGPTRDRFTQPENVTIITDMATNCSAR